MSYTNIINNNNNSTNCSSINNSNSNPNIDAKKEVVTKLPPTKEAIKSDKNIKDN